MKVSIIVPVYNEEKTICKVLSRLQKLGKQDFSYEIIVVDDGSTDTSVLEIKKSKLQIPKLKVVSHRKNKGKGMAVRTGIKHATGDYVVIQDADLEYDPQDIPRLVKALGVAGVDVVYGTRLDRLPNLQRDERVPLFLLHFLGNRFLSLVTSILYGQWITDMETCYKLFPKKALVGIKLESRGFEFEPEITAKLLKKGSHIYEIPIKTNPRGYDDGKKLNTTRDGTHALWTLIKYRIYD